MNIRWQLLKTILNTSGAISAIAKSSLYNSGPVPEGIYPLFSFIRADRLSTC